MDKIVNWFRRIYNQIIHSVAFVPAIIVLFFFFLSYLLNQLDLSQTARNFFLLRDWFSLKDVESARDIVSTVTTGIISLTVFSFTMVLIVMNQAAGKMSNRILDSLIGNRFQKIVLGFYIGTIAFALSLLSNISSSDNGEYIPSISVYFLIILTMIDIFLFIYFLHFITQSLIYGQIIKKIHHQTENKLNNIANKKRRIITSNIDEYGGKTYNARQSGYFQRFNEGLLVKLTREKQIIINFLRAQGDYVLEGTPLFSVIGEDDAECIDKVYANIEFYYGQEIDNNPYYGFQHLMEVAVKALSPGLNDQGTAILCIHALTDLLCNRIKSPVYSIITDKNKNPRIIMKERSVEELFSTSMLPIWDYGKNDRQVQRAFLSMIAQIQYLDKEGKYKSLFNSLLEELEEKTENKIIPE